MNVRIWEGKVRGDRRWIVAYSVGGKMVRKFFADKSDAIALRDELSGDPDATSAQWALVPKQDRYGILKALDLASHHGLGIYDCVAKCIQGHTPPPSSTPPPTPPVPAPKRSGKILSDAAAEIVSAKESASRRPQYVSEFNRSIRSFIEGRESMNLSSVDTGMIEHWSAQWPNPATRKGKLDHMRVFFSFAVRRGWITQNPCTALEMIKVDSRTPRILTVEQCDNLMRGASRDMIGYLTLCLYGGLRPAEAQRLAWDKVNLDRAVVTIDSRDSKTHQVRYVPLSENAVAWLRMAPRKDKFVAPSIQTVRRRRRALAAAIGLEWTQDVLRHTGASMMMAGGKTSAEVTDILGNSRDMLFKHYRKLATKEEADAFFGIYPISVAQASA
jgi:site-specific recombinase XerD